MKHDSGHGVLKNAQWEQVLPEPMKGEASTESGLEGVGKQTGLYGVGVILSRALGIVLLPFYTRFLTPADYGVMELITMALDVVMIVAGAQLVQGIYRFYNIAETPDSKNRVVFTTLLLVGLTFATMGAIAFTTAPWLSELLFDTTRHSNLIKIAAITVALTPSIMVPHAYFRMRDRAGLVVASNLGKLLFAAVLNIILLLRGWGILALFTSSLLATILIGGPLVSKMLREVGRGVSAVAARNLIRYGVPLMAVNVATFTYTFADRFFLQNAGDESVVGLYRFAYQFGFLLLTLGYAPFMMVWGPRRFRIASRPDRDWLYAQGFLYVNLLLLPTAAGMVIFIDDFFRIMTTPAYFAAAQYVPVIVTAYVIKAWTDTQDIGILVRGRTELLTVANWIAAGVAVTGFALLIPRYLAWGAAWTTLATFSVRYVMVFTLSQRLWSIRYRWAPVIRAAAYCSAAAGISLLLPALSLPVSLALRITLFSGLLWCLWTSDILSDDDRRALRRRMKAIPAWISRRTTIPDRS